MQGAKESDGKMDIVDPQITEYLDKTLTVPTALLREMEREGQATQFPIVGRQAGRLLHLLARSVGAGRILELGSGYGYSAMWFADAVGKSGRVVLTEESKENAARAKEYFKRAGMLDRVQIEIGNGLDIIARVPGWFDVIFNDIAKKDYPLTLDLVRPKLRVGGLFISDNMLWGGEVLTSGRSADLRGIKEFTRLLLAAPDFTTTIVPVGDGIAVALKIT